MTFDRSQYTTIRFALTKEEKESMKRQAQRKRVTLTQYLINLHYTDMRRGRKAICRY